MPFAGFSESTIGFLAELSRNNDGAWFEAHREACENALIEPAKAFVEALGPAAERFAINRPHASSPSQFAS